jgi:hypothetical protein
MSTNSQLRYMKLPRAIEIAAVRFRALAFPTPTIIGTAIRISTLGGPPKRGTTVEFQTRSILTPAFEVLPSLSCQALPRSETGQHAFR